MHCRCELDALTLRLELSDDQPPPIDSLFLSSAPSPGYIDHNNNANNQKTILTLPLKNYTGFTQFGSNNTTEYWYTSPIPNRFMYNIISQNAFVPEHYTSFVQMQNIHDKVRARCYKVKFKKDFAPILPLPLGTKWNHSKMTCEWKNLSHNLL